MFICGPCLRKRHPNVFIFTRSEGPCEDCGKTRICADIPTSALPPKRRRRRPTDKNGNQLPLKGTQS